MWAWRAASKPIFWSFTQNFKRCKFLFVCLKFCLLRVNNMYTLSTEIWNVQQIYLLHTILYILTQFLWFATLGFNPSTLGPAKHVFYTNAHCGLFLKFVFYWDLSETLSWINQHNWYIKYNKTLSANDMEFGRSEME